MRITLVHRQATKPLARTLLCLAAIVILTTQTAFADLGRLSDEDGARLAATLREYKTVGASVVLIKNGGIAAVYNYGKANREDGTLVGDDTLFRVGSVSKMVTALGVLKLVEEDIIDLDADIGDYFGFTFRNPYHPKDIITLRQIMTHTSSLVDYGFYNDAILNGKVVSLSGMFASKSSVTNFARTTPGHTYDYSNFGGGLLGSLIERVTATTIDDWLRATVFDKIGATASYFTPNLPPEAYIAKIYNADSLYAHMDSMSLTNTDYVADFERHYIYTAGGLSIRSIDLAKILIAIAGDGTYAGTRILKQSTVERMREAQNNIGTVYCESGKGLNLNIITDSLVKGRTLYGHQGKAYGMICAAYCDPTDGSGVVLLTNGCDDSTLNSVARIAKAVLTVCYDIMPGLD